ncbi:metallophosphoesterase [Paenibacillus azoreducens]|uniref:Metallophosphoesterase YkuE n=1 Tax=Paenibacillus azoreducens TaxID=116718 RepID=A0A919Y9C5_9BACL|nr:metallophosphoesterase [Paenibacillus azoreducens]GIO46579.1 putative metallophosphoesterase YkuE [Paenibacillus azoreducens]
MKNNMNNGKMSRRAFLKRCGAAILGAGMLTGGYAWFWEPRQLDVIRLTYRFPRLPAAFDGMTIAQFSDLHIGFHTHEKDIDQLCERIANASPDLILFTGDAVDSGTDAMPAYLPQLASMQAKLGKFAILGNHDYLVHPDRVSELLDAVGFKVLRNEHSLVKYQGETIAIVGLEDEIMGDPDPEQSLAGVPPELFTLLMMHEPDYADIAAAYPFDMQLSGHSHGGQVRFPLLGAVLTPPGARRYIMGAYAVGKRSMPLYVNRGIGETHLPIRFLCRPELTIITLRTGP